MCDYAIRFRTPVAESGWNSTALYNEFLKGLADLIQDLLVTLDLPTGLDNLIALAIQTDNQLRQLRPGRKNLHRGRSTVLSYPEPPGASSLPAGRRDTSSHHHPPMEGEGESMQLGRARLMEEERRRQQLEGRCFYCGETGHLVITCPTKRSLTGSQVAASGPVSRTLTKVKVTHHTVTNLEALIDSGADESLMDWGLAEGLGIKSEPLANPFTCTLRTTKSKFPSTYSDLPHTL